VLVSPLIAPGTVFRVPEGATPLDHTSILKTIEVRWNLPALTKRDAAAVDIGDALTLAAPRTDDPLQGVTAPVAPLANIDQSMPSHLQQIQAELVSQLPVPDGQGGTHHTMPPLKTSAACKEYIRGRTAAWQKARARTANG
jgi:phospholipase C